MANTKLGLLLGHALSLTLVWPPAGGQEPSLVYRQKAAFLTNFTKFIEWPAKAMANNAPFHICIMGIDPFGDALAKMVIGERVNSHPLIVDRVSGQPPAHCHIAFFERSQRNVARTIAQLGTGVLTVGESDDFLRSGGVIRFVVENNRVRFDINQSAARRESLTVSSHLLKLARVVESGGD